MKKRLLSVSLAFVLAFSFVSPALAVDAATPAVDVQFFSLVGQEGQINIETAIVVQDNYYNSNITEYPSLYIQKDGALTLLRSFTAADCGCSEIRDYDANGNALPLHAYINLFYTDEEYLAFDFTADYVLKIPAGIYKDASGTPIGQQYVSFSGSDIKNDRNEITLFGRYFDKFASYLYSVFHGTPFMNIIYVPFLNITNYLFGILNIHLTKPVTVG